jgi:hypothetical protein
LDHSSGADSYWRTVEEFVTRYAIFPHPIPERVEDVRSIYDFLQAHSGIASDHFAPEVLKYNLALANKGDAEGQFLMGKRYRDGNGVRADNTHAKELFARAAAQGNVSAGRALEDLTTFVPQSLIVVTASSQFSPMQSPRHLVDRSGMKGNLHDNQRAAETMWQSVEKPSLKSPARNLPPSPAWVKFDFALPQTLDAVLIWNDNQANLTDRGFRETRICASSDNITWFPLTSPTTIELPRASGSPDLSPVTITNRAATQTIKSVIIAAEPDNGNYGSDCFGLSAVRFKVHR